MRCTKFTRKVCVFAMALLFSLQSAVQDSAFSIDKRDREKFAMSKSRALAPPSQTEALVWTLQRRQQRNAWVKRVKGYRVTDPDIGHRKISNPQVEVLGDLTMIFNADIVENVIRQNYKTWLKDTTDRIELIGTENMRSLLNKMARLVPVEDFEDAFYENSVYTMDVLVALFHMGDPDLAQRIVQALCGCSLREGISTKLGRTRDVFKRFPRFLGITRILHALSTTDDARAIGLLESFPWDQYADSFGTSTKEWNHLLADMVSSDGRQYGFLEKIREKSRSVPSPSVLSPKDFEEALDDYLGDATGLTLDKTIGLAAEWETGAFGSRLGYHRDIQHPVCAGPLWALLRKALIENYDLEVKPFAAHVNVIPWHLVNLPFPISSRCMTMSLSLGAEELRRIHDRGFRLIDPEVGAIEYLIMEDTLIVLEIQNYWKDRKEMVPADLIKRYQSWPILALLALEDYARGQGIKKIIIPDVKFVQDRMYMSEEKREKRQLRSQLQYLYERLPVLLNYEPESFPPQVLLEGGNRDAVLQSGHSKMLIDVPEKVPEFGDLLNANAFIERYGQTMGLQGKAASARSLTLMQLAQSIGGILANGKAQDKPFTMLRREISSAAEMAGYPWGAIRWNYVWRNNDEKLNHGISIAGEDFVFDENGVFQKRTFPELIPEPIHDQSGAVLAEGLRVDGLLKRWPIAIVISHASLWVQWGQSFTNEGLKHEKYLWQEYLKAWAFLLQHLPEDSEQFSAVMQAIDKQIRRLNDPDKIEFLIILGLLWDKLAKEPRGMESVGDLCETLSAMLASNIPSASRIAREFAHERVSLSGFLNIARPVIATYDDKLKCRQALLFTAVAWLAGGQQDEKIQEMALSVYDKIPPRTFPNMLNDILVHWLIFGRSKDSSKLLMPHIFRLAKERPLLDIHEFQRVLESVVILQRWHRRGEEASIFQRLLSCERWDDLMKRVSEELARLQKTFGPMQTYPMPDLLLRIMDRLRECKSVKLAGQSWQLCVQLDNPEDYRVAEINIYPTHAAKRADRALDLLQLEFKPEETPPPRGSMAWLNITLAEVGERTCLMILGRQAQSAYWKLLGVSDRHRAYRQWMEELIGAITVLLADFREVEGLVYVTHDNLRGFTPGMSSDVLHEFYSERRFLRQWGFVHDRVAQGDDLLFRDNMMFRTNRLHGPFITLDKQGIARVAATLQHRESQRLSGGTDASMLARDAVGAGL